MVRAGYLLTRQWHDRRDGIELVYWMASADGPLRVRITGQEAVLFLPERDLPVTTDILRGNSGWRFRSVKLRDFHFNAVHAHYFKSHKGLLDARDRLEKRGLRPLESDIRPADRFLMERFVRGALEVDGEGALQQGFTAFENPVIQPMTQQASQQASQQKEYRPQLKALSLDIETSITQNTLLSIAVMDESDQRVFMIGQEQDVPGSIEYLDDERAVITRFLEWIELKDPDLLIGWNVVNFDLWFLQERCDALRLAFALGRDRQAIEWRRWSGNVRRFALIPGRVALDGIELLRSANYSFESFSLENVSQSLLGRGKLLVDDDRKALEIEELFEADKASLAEYNLEDCRLVWEIFVTERLINFALERSSLTGLELDRQGGSVAAFDFLYLPPLHRAGYVAPGGPADAGSGGTPGGYVLDSQPGIYEDVIVLDFKSLYPSIIRTFHVDPLAMADADDPDNQDAEPIPGFEGARFSRDNYLLPGIIENLWTARDQAKTEDNGVLSHAIKIIMNSFYGVLGSPGCRFFDPRLVSSITLRGHEIIRRTRDLIEEKGYSVIYGDTDSVFVWINHLRDGESVDDVGRRLAQELNAWWQEDLAGRFKIKSFLELEFETHFSKFLMPTIRGSDRGSKKRYAGMIRNGSPEIGDEQVEFLFKGLESVRSDWTRLAKDFQVELYRLIFLDEPFEEYIRDTVRAVLTGKKDDDLVFRKRIRRALGEYTKNVPPSVQAARKEDRAREERGLQKRYDRGGWIEYINTVNGPEPRQYRDSMIDYQFYIDRQLTPIADAILTFKATTMKEIIDRQLGLF